MVSRLYTEGRKLPTSPCGQCHTALAHLTGSVPWFYKPVSTPRPSPPRNDEGRAACCLSGHSTVPELRHCALTCIQCAEHGVLCNTTRRPGVRKRCGGCLLRDARLISNPPPALPELSPLPLLAPIPLHRPEALPFYLQAARPCWSGIFPS